MTKPPKDKAAAPKASPSSDEARPVGGSLDAVVQELRQIASANVRLFRGAQRKTQRDLAAAAGISQKHLSAIELTGSNLTLDLLARLCAALEVTPAQLLTKIDLPSRR